MGWVIAVACCCQHSVRYLIPNLNNNKIRSDGGRKCIWPLTDRKYTIPPNDIPADHSGKHRYDNEQQEWNRLFLVDAPNYVLVNGNWLQCGQRKLLCTHVQQARTAHVQGSNLLTWQTGDVGYRSGTKIWNELLGYPIPKVQFWYWYTIF